MKVLRFFRQITCFLAVCASLAGADSLELRNGRHVQGKYVGGTTGVIGFMTGRSIEYFATSDVLMLVFDNDPDGPLSSLQPSPMNGDAPSETSARQNNLRQMSARPQTRAKRPGPTLVRVSAVSKSVTQPDATASQK
jgi:hypothetical protein